MSIHDGHRQRLKQRFLTEGIDSFTEVQALELALFYCIPRKDTNPIAHGLLERFGSLSQVLEAPVEELTKVDGISENAATFLRFLTEMGRFYQVNRANQHTILDSIERCAEFLVPRFYGRRLETVFLLCLDAKCKLLCCKKVGEGSVNSANVPVRRIVEIALGVNATTVVLAHNHPSGLAIPSADDIQTTYRVAAALDTVDIVLADHIVVSQGEYVSMVQSQFYKPDNTCSVR